MKPVDEKEIKEAITEKPDKRGKHLLSLKVIAAKILKEFLPENFKGMSVQEIARSCFEGDPDDPFLVLLSEEKNNSGDSNFISDLVFKAFLPIPLKIFGKEFSEILVNYENQNNEPNKYLLSIRGMLYTSQHFLNENKSLKLQTTEKMYENSIPIYNIWFNTDSKIKETKVETIKVIREITYPFKNENNYIRIEEDSMLNTIIVDIGNDIDLEDENFFSFAKTIFKGKETKILTLLKKYLNIKGDSKMILTAFEQEAYDKGVKEITQNMKPKWINEGREELLNQMIKSLQEKDPSLSDQEALNQIKKQFNLK